MPIFVSQAQHRAFRAAAAGKSYLGISRKVGQRAVAENAGRRLGSLPHYVKTKHRLKGGSRR